MTKTKQSMINCIIAINEQLKSFDYGHESDHMSCETLMDARSTILSYLHSNGLISFEELEQLEKIDD